MRNVDINADIGESYGAWTMGDDAALMPLISSANIACGFHAGDANTMTKTVALCKQHGVAIGAHPSFPDLHGFGRREMHFPLPEIHAMVLYQLGALAAIAQAQGTKLHHVKPHGAMYNMAAKDSAMAQGIARAVRDFDRHLVLVGLANSCLVNEGKALGLKVRAEGFADRRYRSDGFLVPRTHELALIEDVDEAVAQALLMTQQGRVKTADGKEISLHVDTICVHGDGAQALLFAQQLREHFSRKNISVSAG